MNKKPFGLLFEELAVSPKNHFSPIYDEDDGLSYLENELGEKIPFVESFALVSTNTMTAVKAESTDTDPGDDDGNRVSFLATQTLTHITDEGTDTDPGADENNYRSQLLTATDTFTKEENESTDKD